MPADGAFAKISEDRWRKLLSIAVIGRVAFNSTHGLQLIPLNFFYLDGCVYFRVDQQRDLLLMRNRVHPALDQDAPRPAVQVFMMIGLERHIVVSCAELAQHALEQRRQLQPWAIGDRNLFMRLKPWVISGRKVVRHSR